MRWLGCRGWIRAREQASFRRWMRGSRRLIKLRSICVRPSRLRREPRELDARGYVELRENVLEVRGDGVRREIQLVRDLFVRPPLRGKLRDPVLGDGQAVPAADRPHACCGNTR